MQSTLERKFIGLWNVYHADLILTPEYSFCKPRRFRADFAHLTSKVLIELQGGVWLRGKSKHSSGVGISRDCEKLFLASSLGYLTFQLTTNMIDMDHLDVIAKTINSRRLIGVAV